MTAFVLSFISLSDFNVVYTAFSGDIQVILRSVKVLQRGQWQHLRKKHLKGNLDGSQNCRPFGYRQGAHNAVAQRAQQAMVQYSQYTLSSERVSVQLEKPYIFFSSPVIFLAALLPLHLRLSLAWEAQGDKL